MTKKDIKSVLCAARNARKEIEELDKRIEEAQEKLCRCTSLIRPDGVGRSTGIKKEDIYINTIEYKRLIENYRDKRYKELNEAMELIGLLREGRLVRIMMFYYLDGLTWAQTAEKINMSEYWVRTQLHSRALKEIQKKQQKAI